MHPRDQAREWLDQRCGRHVQVETTFVHSSQSPLVNAGLLTRQHGADRGSGALLADPSPSGQMYQVGTVSYNLADLAEGTELRIRADDPEHLEITFDDGTSLLMTARITVMEEEGGQP